MEINSFNSKRLWPFHFPDQEVFLSKGRYWEEFFSSQILAGIKTLSFKMFLNHCMYNRPKIKPRLLKLLKESTGDYLNNFKADKKLLEKKQKH